MSAARGVGRWWSELRTQLAGWARDAALAPGAGGAGPAREASERRWRLVFLATVIAYGASCLVWIGINQAPYSSDSVDFVIYCRLAQRWLQDPSAEGMRRLVTIYGYDPPLFFLLQGALFEIFGFVPKILSIVSLAWGLGTLVVLGRWCRRACSSWAPAALAVLFVATSPGFQIFSKIPAFQMPTAFFCALTMSLLFRPNALGGWRRCLALGLAFSVGALVKLYFPLIMAVPTLLVVLWLVAGGIKRRDLAPLRGALLSLLVVLVVALPYYIYRLSVIFGHSVTEELGQSAGPGAWAEFLTFYPRALHQTYFLLPLTAVALVAVVSALRLRLAQRVLVWGLLPGLLVFSLIQNKDARFMAPLLPTIGFLVGLGLAQIKEPLLRVGATAVLVVFGVWHLGVFPFLPHVEPGQLPLAYAGVTRPVPPGGVRIPLQAVTDAAQHRRFSSWFKASVIRQRGPKDLLALTGGSYEADRVVSNLMDIYYRELAIVPLSLMFNPGEIKDAGPQVWINDYLGPTISGLFLDAKSIPYEYLLLPWPIDDIPLLVPQYGNSARMIDPLFSADRDAAKKIRARLPKLYRLYEIYREPTGESVVFLYRKKR